MISENQLWKRTSLLATLSKPRPTVLIFDSGVGGLLIYEEICHLLPDLHYIYAFDSAAFPYGEKHAAFIVERVLEITSIVQRHYPLALAVIACNTASSVSLSALRKVFQFPVVGVVPAIKSAVRLTLNGIIGLLATRGTVESLYTRELIDCFGNECQVAMLGSSELVEMAEAKLYGEPISLDEVRHILLPWLCMPEFPDTIVLGCTHFLLLQDELSEVLPKGTRLVDSRVAVAQRTAWVLEHEALGAQSSDDNIAFCFCAADNKKVERLLPVLHRFGFERFERLLL